MKGFFILDMFFFFFKDDSKVIPNQKSKLAVAVCVKVHIKAKSSEKIDFSLVWNMPNIRFNDESKLYKRL